VGCRLSRAPLVSMEEKIADGLRLKIGDELVVNVLGRDIRPGSAICAPWTGKISASISCWYSHPDASRARRIPCRALTETHPDAAGDARIVKSGPTHSRW